MSIDLTIFPLRGGAGELDETSVLVCDRLDFDGDYRIFGQLNDMIYCEDMDLPKPTIIPHPLPLQLWVRMFMGGGIERTREDSYGAELVVVYAQQMKKLVIPADASPWNKAIKAFIDALPNDTPIILNWH